jgi:flagellum-specific ATP synthase
LANRGHYPAIDILQSISRVMPDIIDQQHSQAAQLIVQLTAVYRDIEDLVNIGAYAVGTNPEYDLALRARPVINEFLQQKIAEGIGLDQAISTLKKLAAQIADTSNAEKTNAKTARFPNNANHSPSRQISVGLKKTMAGT